MFSFPGHSAPDHTIWTVGELTNYVRQMFEMDYRLRDIDVSGEISNFTRAASGHIYFTLKDQEAQLPAVMFRTDAQRLKLLALKPPAGVPGFSICDGTAAPGAAASGTVSASAPTR